MATTGSEIIYQGAFGRRDLGTGDAMTADSVFWIASMTKAITTAAGMQLVEQGKLSLDEPIGKLLPDLAAPQVFEGFDASGKPKLRAAKRAITLRHLMTHTAGYCYNIWNGAMGQYMEHAGIPGITTCENKALTLPLASDPGERWEYGINIDWVGKAVEAVSGKRLDAYLHGPHLRAARHARHRLQARRVATRAPRRHARARRRRIADAGAVRDGAGAGIPHGRRRALRHRAGLHPLRAHAAQWRRARRQPRARRPRPSS